MLAGNPVEPEDSEQQMNTLSAMIPWARSAWLALAATLLLAGLPVRAADEFLEPQQAFQFSARAAGPDEIEVQFQIAPGYYMYRQALKAGAEGATLGDLVLPAGKVKFDETFQKEVETYREVLRLRIPVRQANADGLLLSMVSQGCADAGLCYPPMTSQAKVSLVAYGGDGTVRLLGPDAEQVSSGVLAGVATSKSDGRPLGEAGTIERVLRGGSWWATIGAFWVMGLLLSFTPCVLPMLPILSSILTGGAEVSRRRGFALALAYSLGMAIVYTALGVAAGLAGEGLAAALQTPWVLATFAAMLALFSLSMFDVYELRLPTAWATGLDGASRRFRSGRLVGVFAMGGISALIVSPCVTAPLAGALLFLSQTRDVALSATALFALAAGMSVPLLLLGASAGAWLPRSGAWMHAIKRFFGLLLLAVALWVVQPVLPAPVALALWGALLLVAGFMLRPFDANPHSGAPRIWLQRASGIAALAWGVMQLVGAASGGHDPLQPLVHLAQARGTAASSDVLAFRTVRSVAELDSELQRAGRPVMLDFYADWCVSCKEMERFTFSDPVIQARLSKAVLLKADVTANNPDDRALLKRFQLFGPPGTIFFDANGAENTTVRVIGFQNAATFAKSLDAAGL